MEASIHTLAALFDQLGLDSSDRTIHAFINKHKPLRGSVDLYQAEFWSPSQEAFLQQAKDADADWAEIVDQLNAMLR
ncbi:hypothetical protein BJAS_P4584 [Bathymodiolus japonicus methanotrophic gill symbiont]|uniref:DUF2789 domain-containing protein n=1 Tax=Bathymodiolus japonicus methanotrophic gill symbiont TaxID=113269 RepID=UPI001B611AD0|nr:DUF2789 domain-containing protein [Bathymodiolus japonicus methanotrophic gill symbiont]GFO73658.1 hypothetical protein BJAS_P4584 [Bathymodiolus japonicus methanotrophic gill symbiont]